MSERPLRIGVIGCGRILPAHFRGMQSLRQAGFDAFRVTALVARTVDDCLRFCRRGEGPDPRSPVASDPNDALAAPHSYVSDWQPEEDSAVFDSVQAMLDANIVDAVTITTSLPSHHDIAVMALEAGLHVMVEKPLAVSIRGGRQIVEQADLHGLTLGVMEMVRYQPETRMLRWLIERGDLGEIQMAAAVSFGTTDWSPDRVVGDTPWRHRKLSAGGGASVDIGVHLFHRLRYLVGEITAMSAVARVFHPVRTVRDGKGEVFGSIQADADDAFFALPEFDNGAIGNVSFTWAGAGEPTSLPGGLTLYGTNGCLKGMTFINAAGQSADVRELFAEQADESLKEHWFPGGVTDAFGLTYLDWMRSIKTGTQPETSGRDALRDLACAFAIMEAAESGRAVAIEDVLSGAVAAYQQAIDEHYFGL